MNMCGVYAGGITLYRSHTGTPEIWTCRRWCRMRCRRVRGGLADQGKVERHKARDCTAHAGLTGKELDEFRWGGGGSSCCVCWIDKCVWSQPRSSRRLPVSFSPPLDNSFDIALVKQPSTRRWCKPYLLIKRSAPG